MLTTENIGFEENRMKICFAVEKDDGVNSSVYGHFGSAPLFIMVDTNQKVATSVKNEDAGHAHGACNPLRSIGGLPIDAVVVGGIGAGALMKLNAAGVKVFRSAPGSVRENLDLFEQKKLTELTANDGCSGHQSGGGCGHH
ncbi:MAG: NifB/NifX family molybdenum-iron cluster-binding protein [Syntrophorhabdus sp.]|jgi:predicted Fe-Mo cluster-binding NifX family protein|nr:NifB/NifX family molybdenum-iron cluster-binding protein [Syntrophorhabdus sp.]MDI9557854.1 NifB/NifX family molybdenum-iron cluster-binding protein [Pseudomonadota bacterium]HNY70664.1 NifB/NifX family molybdenum-iron cluster-binding protein [Syntrophorhabdus sp.]HOH26753.1 NifB/NifX family molybdenum-iron cluster-binding protein [Syntrophorhabdus sp.]HQM25366.1 NifB/NifX family molybdenum-iron cluster-binding protein [Syntrophorhabdus sp.]